MGKKMTSLNLDEDIFDVWKYMISIKGYSQSELVENMVRDWMTSEITVSTETEYGQKIQYGITESRKKLCKILEDRKMKLQSEFETKKLNFANKIAVSNNRVNELIDDLNLKISKLQRNMDKTKEIHLKKIERINQDVTDLKRIIINDGGN